MSVAAIGELNGDDFVTVSFCGMNTRTEEKLRGKAMSKPEHYEKWILESYGDNVGHQKAAEVIAKFKKKGLVE